MKSIVISIAAFLFLAIAATLLVFIYLFHVPPEEIADKVYSEGKFFLYKHNMVAKLSATETKQFYKNTCTRTCHSSDLIEKKPRTAAEWEWVVNRMKASDRANLPDHAAAAIKRYLQNNYLSNVPTVLPEKTMRFVRKHLWKSDFGESDLYLDIIYIPHSHISLLPYMVASNELPKKQGAVFVLYLNTHQGTIPPWKVAKMAVLKHGKGSAQKAIDWEVLYEDSQYHHKQGTLIFPDFDSNNLTAMEVTIHLPGMRKRVFQWKLPVPALMEQESWKPLQ
jgi:hypothetical protein